MKTADAEKKICPPLSANDDYEFTRCHTKECMAWVESGFIENKDTNGKSNKIEYGYCKIIFPDGDNK
jgi:hypothetical protein